MKPTTSPDPYVELGRRLLAAVLFCVPSMFSSLEVKVLFPS